MTINGVGGFNAKNNRLLKNYGKYGFKTNNYFTPKPSNYLLVGFLPL